MTEPPLDLLYLVGPGEDNQELRYSLRSVAANLPHSRVWVAGYQPRWVTGTTHIYVDQFASPANSSYENVITNLAAALAHRDFPRQFVLFNDDFFVTKPLKTVPVQNMGPIDQVIEQWKRKRGGGFSRYLYGLEVTHVRLRDNLGIDEPLCYALHTPMIMNKHLVGSTLRWLEANAHTNAPHVRTVYGNLAGVGGETVPDPKVNDGSMAALQEALDYGSPFLSTSDRAFREGAAGQYIRRLFPAPCRYEKPPRAAAATA